MMAPTKQHPQKKRAQGRREEKKCMVGVEAPIDWVMRFLTSSGSGLCDQKFWRVSQRILLFHLLYTTDTIHTCSARTIPYNLL